MKSELHHGVTNTPCNQKVKDTSIIRDDFKKRHDFKIPHYVKKYIMTSKLHHDVKYPMTSKKFVITTKMRHYDKKLHHDVKAK